MHDIIMNAWKVYVGIVQNTWINDIIMNAWWIHAWLKKKIRTRTPLLVVRVRAFFWMGAHCSRHTPSSLLLRSIQHNHPSMSLLMLLLSVFTSLSDEEGSEWKSSEQCNHHGSFTLSSNARAPSDHHSCGTFFEKICDTVPRPQRTKSRFSLTN